MVFSPTPILRSTEGHDQLVQEAYRLELRDSPRRMIRMSHFISPGVIVLTQRLRMRACSTLFRGDEFSIDRELS